jgi:ABC-2 type transport system ATP-binding protein
MSTQVTSRAAPALRFGQVGQSYGAERVLNDFDLVVGGGEFFGLVGINGAGKTTLVKSLLDLCEVDKGTIEIFGIRHRRTESRRRLAFLPERFSPPYFLRGEEFLRYMSRLYGCSHDEARVGEVLAALDLAPAVLRRPVRELSKGMAQKLGLAGCLLSGRDLLVLDEPMTGLDPKARALFKQQLLRARDSGRTVFFSTHLLADVEALCDRMGILHDGSLRFVGTPQECCRTYQASTLERAFMRCIEA